MDHGRVLRRAGWFLVVFGLADIGVMAYCIANQISYSSSFNIFAVAAGIFLIRGHLGAARLVAWFSAFYFTVFALAPLLFLPKWQPDEGRLAELQSEPMAFAGSVTFMLVFLGGLAWVYWQLRQPSVLQARAAAGLKTTPPYSAFAAAIAFMAVFAIMFYDVPLTKSAKSRPPRREQTVVLQKEPAVLQPGTRLAFSDPLEVLGETSSLCVVLRSGIDLRPKAEMDRAFKTSLGDSRITVAFARADDQTFVLEATSQAWKRFGEITGAGELAACTECGCTKPSCDELFPTGTKINGVSVTSSAPLSVLGVYWHSTNAFDSWEERTPDKAASASHQPLPRVIYTCGTGPG